MVTGDGNLVEVSATLRYRVADPRAYLFAVQRPGGPVRSAAESALREQVAAQPFLELLTTRRSSLPEGRVRPTADRGCTNWPRTGSAWSSTG